MTDRMIRIAVGLGIVLAAVGPSVGECSVRLNEVLADPDRDWDGDGLVSSRNDEWVEVVSTDGGPLEGYYIGDETGAFVFGLGGTLAPGQVRVVFGGDSVVWESNNGESATGLRLGNTGDTVTLWQVSGADTVLVDAYTYTDHEAENDRSSGRLPDGADSWALFDGWTPYTGDSTPAGTGMFPTPGAANGSWDPSPIETATWGRIKALYGTP